MSNLHINWTRYSEQFVQLNHCPTCERDRRMLGQFQEWYGTEWTCLGCGDRWADGERADRPFEPGWRQFYIRRARKVVESIGLQA